MIKINILRKKQTLLTGGILFGLFVTIAVPFAKTNIPGDHPMSSISVSITIKNMPKKVICGGSIMCEVEVKNNSADEISVPALAPFSPIQYVFKLVSDGSQRIVSRKNFSAFMKSGRSFPAIEQKFVTLKSGECLTNREGDLAVSAIDPLLPGDYTITASIEINKTTFTSVPVSLTLCSPEIQLLESYFSSLYQIVNSIFIESRCHAGKALFLRPAFGNNPVIGVAGIPFELEKMPEAIAAVEKVESDATGQWVCWQDGTAITGAWGDVYLKFRVFGSTKVDLDSPQLLPLGFTLSNNTGTFFVRGQKNGKTVLQSITFSEKGSSEGPVVAVTGNPVAAIKIQYNRPGKYFTVFWVETSGGNVCTLKYGKYDEKAGIVSNVTTLCTTEGHLLSWAVHSAISKESDKNRFAVLFGDADGKSISFLQKDAGTDESSHPVTIMPPPGPADGWSVAPSYDDNPLILVRSEKHLLWYEVGGDKQWRAFAHDDQGISHVSQFVRYTNEYWAQWVNTQVGLRFKRIPYYVRPPKP
jgi:hypothetical protein